MSWEMHCACKGLLWRWGRVETVETVHCCDYNYNDSDLTPRQVLTFTLQQSDFTSRLRDQTGHSGHSGQHQSELIKLNWLYFLLSLGYCTTQLHNTHHPSVNTQNIIKLQQSTMLGGVYGILRSYLYLYVGLWKLVLPKLVTTYFYIFDFVLNWNIFQINLSLRPIVIYHFKWYFVPLHLTCKLVNK